MDARSQVQNKETVKDLQKTIEELQQKYRIALARSAECVVLHEDAEKRYYAAIGQRVDAEANKNSIRSVLEKALRYEARLAQKGVAGPPSSEGNGSYAEEG